MSSKSTILLTTDNEHWYKDCNATHWEGTKAEEAIILEIGLQHTFEVTDEGLRIVIEEGTELFKELKKLKL